MNNGIVGKNHNSNIPRERESNVEKKIEEWHVEIEHIEVQEKNI